MYLKLSRQLMAVLVIAVFAALVSCSNSNNNKQEQTKSVNILYPNWAEGIAMSYLAKAALEDHGYEVELTNLEPGLIYGELSKENSKGDVFLDAWLPHTHKDYWADYGDDLVKLGEAFPGGTTGLVVPAYVDINSIEDLNANKEKFDQKIIGIGSGAGIHANTLKAIDEYELDFEQVTSSGPAMVASLEKAIKDEEWIVITGWKPHFKWAKNDLKYLEDPKGIYPVDACTIIARRGFEEDSPEAAEFFKNFQIPEEKLYALMEAVEMSGEEDGAQQFYERNKEMINNWFE